MHSMATVHARTCAVQCRHCDHTLLQAVVLQQTDSSSIRLQIAGDNVLNISTRHFVSMTLHKTQELQVTCQHMFICYVCSEAG